MMNDFFQKVKQLHGLRHLNGKVEERLCSVVEINNILIGLTRGKQDTPGSSLVIWSH